MYLLIDTANIPATLGMADESGRVIRETAIGQAGRLSDELIPAIKKFGGDLSGLKGIGVVTGPGSYTSLRVGLTAANALAYALNIPVWGITQFELYREKQEAKMIVLENIQDLVYLDFNQKLSVMTVAEAAKVLSGEVWGDVAPAKEAILRPVCEYHRWGFIDGEKMRIMAKKVILQLKTIKTFTVSVLPLYIIPPHITKRR